MPAVCSCCQRGRGPAVFAAGIEQEGDLVVVEEGEGTQYVCSTLFLRKENNICSTLYLRKEKIFAVHCIWGGRTILAVHCI